MRQLHWATGAGLRTVHWTQQQPCTWEQFVHWLDLTAPADHKECGGYVGGLLRETTGHQGKPRCVGLHRNARAVVSRSIVALDVDAATATFALDAPVELSCALALYTTWSSTQDAPRWRALAPLSRDVTPDEYRALVGTLIDVLGAGQFDPGSQEPERLMYRPSTQGGGGCYAHHVYPGPALDADAWLARGGSGGAGGDSWTERRTYVRHVDTSPERDPEDGVHPAAAELVRGAVERLAALPQPWYSGARWDDGVFKEACLLVELANSNWTGYGLDDAQRDLLEHAPTDDVWSDRDNLDKLSSAVHRVGGGGRVCPTDAAEDFGPLAAVDAATGAGAATWPDVPAGWTDAYLAAWLAHKGLDDAWCWSGAFGWMTWTGKCWRARTEEDAREATRRCVLRVYRGAQAAGDSVVVTTVLKLLTTARISALVKLMRGVVSVDPARFDAARDLLNVGNGVVDLRTGELGPHRRDLYLTKMTDTPYVPGARHADWDQALTCLDGDVMDWMHVRIGQAATGWPTSDDVLPIGQGGGSNGKSTLLAGLFVALGDHMTLVPEKLLRASPNDHPTELMSLLGARLAVVDETPEVGQLNVQRLKAVLGTAIMTARGVYKDNVSWRPTHSLFVMSNYTPQVRETDHGTWRRLALVRFDKTFPRDDTFRAAVGGGKDGRREAVLAWVVQGARQWYLDGGVLPTAPPRVEADTADWRGETDYFAGFLDEQLELDPEGSVMASELLYAFNSWMRDRGNAAWSLSTLAGRIRANSTLPRYVVRVQARSAQGVSTRGLLATAPGRPWVWRGLRWKVV